MYEQRDRKKFLLFTPCPINVANERAMSLFRDRLPDDGLTKGSG